MVGRKESNIHTWQTIKNNNQQIKECQRVAKSLT